MDLSLTEPQELLRTSARSFVEREVLPLFAAGRLRVLIADTFALADAASAYERFAAGRKLGKIVLAVGQ